MRAFMRARGKRNGRQAGPDARRIRVVHVMTVGITPKSFLCEHFRRMLNEGFEAAFICSDDDNARYVAEVTGIRFCPVQIEQDLAPFSDVISLYKIWRVFRRLRPHLVDAHMTKAGLMGMLAGLLTRAPIRIYHNHAMAFLSVRGWRHWLLRSLELIACALATDVIYVSASNMNDAVTARVCPRTKARVLGPGTICGLDTGKFDPEKSAPRGRQLRKEAGIPDDAWLAGVVARLVPHKGIETVLQAWRLLPPDIHRQAYLCIFGAFDDRRMQILIEEAVAKPDMHVKYMGYSNELPAWYSTMTLLVQPSWHEGWGYNVLESACCGVPAVGTRISGTRDAIWDGKTGILVPVKDPEALAGAIVRLFKDEGLRNRLGKAARERTLRDFDQASICPLLIEEYHRLLRLRIPACRSRL